VFDLIRSAIPVFILCLAIEAISFHFKPDEDELGYNYKDSRTSILMGLGNVAINLGWKLVVVATYAAAYLIAPFHLSPHNPWTWVALFFLDDFIFYWYHRTHHTIRVLWASHVVHHSSQFYNLSTAVRQPWTPFSSMPYWIPLALMGFSPWMIVLAQSWNLLYQFFIHTERVDRLWRPLELVMNTPSHHRVHHGSQSQYLDRNYAGIFIIWDRMFGTFEPEGERVRYGLTKNIETWNPVRVALHEFAAIGHDVRRARTWRDRLGYVFKGPGWSPSP